MQAHLSANRYDCQVIAVQAGISSQARLCRIQLSGRGCLPGIRLSVPHRSPGWLAGPSLVGNSGGRAAVLLCSHRGRRYAALADPMARMHTCSWLQEGHVLSDMDSQESSFSLVGK